MTRWTLVALVLFAVSLTSLPGCTTVAKQAFYELRGAKADVALNNEVGNTALRPYQSLEFTPATTTLSTKLCPRDVMLAYDRYTKNLARDLVEEYPGGEPKLVIDSEIIYFQTKGIMSQAQMLTRVRMRDAERVVVDAIVKCESKAFREGGGKDLAETSVKGLGKWLQKQKGVDEED